MPSTLPRRAKRPRPQNPMPEHEPKTCPRCGGGFECRQGSIHRCQCVDVLLSDALREMIALRYDDCLCRDCLLELTGATALSSGYEVKRGEGGSTWKVPSSQ